MEGVNLRRQSQISDCRALGRRRDGLRLRPPPLGPQTGATASMNLTFNDEASITQTYATFSFLSFFFTRDSTEVSPCVSYLEEECRPMKNKATNYSAANSNYMCIFVCLCLQWGDTHTQTHITDPCSSRKCQICANMTALYPKLLCGNKKFYAISHHLDCLFPKPVESSRAVLLYC